jgi:uncharacterized Zn finger protein
MTDSEIGSYVDAACRVQGITLTADERIRVIANFARIAVIAAPLLDLELPADIEQAPVFRP